MLTELTGGQQGAAGGEQGVVVALSGLRVSPWMAACDGVPLIQGWSSAGLHIPGAASLAKTASMVARASG